MLCEQSFSLAFSAVEHPTIEHHIIAVTDCLSMIPFTISCGADTVILCDFLLYDRSFLLVVDKKTLAAENCSVFS